MIKKIKDIILSSRKKVAYEVNNLLFLIVISQFYFFGNLVIAILFTKMYKPNKLINID